MTSPLNENLMTTKDAGELSGYTPDYLARLARSGKISGKRIGHSWLIDRASLDAFLDQQGDRKIDYARALARAREQEYRAHRSVISRATKTLTKPLPMPQFNIATGSLRSQFVALAIAFAVVGGGAFAAQAAAIPQVAEKTAALAREVAFGFDATFGNIPADIAARIDSVGATVDAISARVAAANEDAGARIASPELLAFDLSSAQMPAFENENKNHSVATAFMPAASNDAVLTVSELQTSARDTLALVASPSLALSALAHAYAALGASAYGAVNAAFTGYRSLVDASGAQALALGAATRDALAGAPSFVNRVNLAFGSEIINATHAAIRADVSLAYGTAAAAPASARATVAFIGGAGDLLARATSRVPALAAAGFLNATAAPARLAPAIAQAVFDTEYAAASHFVPAALAVSERYLALVQDTGNVAYAGTSGALALADAAGPALAGAPAAVQDAYLGALGSSALALETVARVPKVAAVLSAVHTAAAPMLAAALPALTVGEQAALTVYQTIHGLFDATNRALAILLGPPPSIVLPAGVPKPRIIAVSTSTAPALGGSYTTIVNGVSSDFVYRSLAAQRSDILATVAGMIQPVAAQGITNMTTIQQVNMIQDLSNLIVRNGDFRGGTFSGGNVSGAVSVSATTGSFGTLSASTANIGTTTVTGNLTVTGTITPGVVAAGSSVSAPYFIASATNATSTFAGSLAVDTNGLVYATSTRNVGIGILSPAALLAIKNSTSTQPIFVAQNDLGSEMFRITNSGFVGIGTSSPTYALAVEGSSSLGNQAIAGYFTATSSSATSAFAGSLAVGTSSPFGAGLFTVGTSSPLIYVSNNSGRIGIGTSTPASILDIYGTDALHLPVGNSAQRPGMALTGQVRYNTQTHQFEGYGDNGVWQGLGGVINAAQTSYITAGTDDYLRFVTASAERMTITNGGNIGVGTTSPFAKFSLAGTAGGTQNLFAVSTSTAGFATTTTLTLDQNGNLALLNGANLTVGGNLTVTGATTFSNAITGPITSTGTSTATYFAASTRGFAGAPAYTFSGDLTTGLWSPLANTLALSTGGTERLRVDPSGYVGVGVTAPMAMMDISAPNTVNNFRLGNATNANATLLTVGTTVNNPHLTMYNSAGAATNLFDTSGVSYVNGGNFGVGTTTPWGELSASSTSAYPTFAVEQKGAGAAATFLGGNVGIGTASPGATLDITGTLRASGALTLQESQTVAGVHYFGKSPTGDGSQAIVLNGTNAAKGWAIADSRVTQGSFEITQLTANGGNTIGTAPALSINNIGNVGIGTTTPESILNVHLASTGYVFNGDSTAGADVGLYSSTFAGQIGTKNNFPFQFFTNNGSAQMTLTTAGNVGIGTTGPLSKLDVNGGVAIGSYAGINAAPGNGLIVSGPVGIGEAAQSGSVLAVLGGAVIGSDTTYTRHAVTNGNLIVQGNVGIGTTNPAARLDVVSSATSSAALILRDPLGGVSLELRASTSTLVNTFVGVGAGRVDTTGSYNASYGYQTLYSNTSGGSNTANGALSLFSNTTGTNNTANGALSLFSNTTGTNNTANGVQALYYSTGDFSAALGYAAGQGLANYSNQGSVSIGSWSGYSLSTGSDYNAFVGYRSGYGVTTGTRNTLLGPSTIAASYNQVTTGSNNIAIGNDVAVASPTASNQLVIGNLIYGTGLNGTGANISGGNIGIGTTTPNATLQVTGSSSYTSTQGTLAVTDSATPTKRLNMGYDATYGAYLQSINVGTALTSLLLNPNGGNVGIGTTSPFGYFSAQQTATNGESIANFNNAGGGTAISTIRVGEGVPVSQWGEFSNFGVDNSTRIRAIASAGATRANLDLQWDGGNVGIGTTSPQSRLAVSGGMSVGADYNIAAPSNGAIIEGNVGIGATGPGAKLEVVSTDATSALWLRNNNVSGITNNYAQFITTADSGKGIYSGVDITNRMFYQRLNDSGDYGFQWQTAGGASKLVTILNSGNVGIGTTSPTALLHVASAFSGGTASIAEKIDYGSNVNRKMLFGVTSGAMLYIQGSQSADETQYRDMALQPSGGNVGIGTTAPGDKLVVRGGGIVANGPDATGVSTFLNSEKMRFWAAHWTGTASVSREMYLQLITNSATDLDHRLSVFSDSGSPLVSITNAGNVGIGTTSPDTLLSVGSATPSGNVAHFENSTGSCYINPTTTALVCSSDARLKYNLNAISTTTALADVLALSPTFYNWNSEPAGTSEHAGFIAQQVQPIFPDLVAQEPDGYLTMNYAGLTPYLTAALQGLAANVRQIEPVAGVLSVGPDVNAQCVVGDTRLRRRRRRADGSWEYDEIDIADVTAGDEIQSLDERTGRVVYSRVNGLMDMGEQEVYELVTKSGRRIRTTANHPFLARERATKS